MAILSISASAQTALEFDGVNDFVNCGNDPSLDITGTAITLEAWIYPTSFQPNIWQGNVINKGDISQTGYMLRVGGTGQINFNFGSFGSWNELNTGINVVSLNTWQHIAATYDGSTSRIFVNGVEVATTNYNTSIASATQPMYLGEDPEYNGRFFPGSIDEVRVWNVTKTAIELMNGMSNEICATDPSLVAYYRFNDGVAGGNNLGQTTLTDDSGNGNNGTLINFANFGNTSNWVPGAILGAGMTNTVIPQDACETYTWPLNGQTYTVSGNYVEMLTGFTGCDSSITLDLNIFSPNDLTTNQTVCDSFFWGTNNTTYYATTSVVENLTTSQGCAYQHTLNVTVNNSFDTVVLVYDECPPYVWGVNGVSYDTSGTYFAQYSTAQGCDSNYQLNLVIYDDAVADISQNGDGSLSTSWTFDIQWVDCATNTPIVGATGSNFMPIANGDYAVIAYGPNWCPDTSDCFTVDYLDLETQEWNHADVTIEPNPTNGSIHVTFPDFAETTEVQILDSKGRILLSKEVNGSNSVNIELVSMPGVYYLKAISDKAITTSRVILY